MTDLKAAGEKVETEIAQTERIGLGDLAIAGILAGLTFLFSILWQFPGTIPSLWNDIAYASGVRPATQVMPGFWRCLATFVYRLFGVNGGAPLLQLLGYVSLMALAVGMYASLREVLAFIMRRRPQYSKRRTFVMQLASLVGAVAFVGSDVVWSSGQFFSETTIQLLLLVGSLEFYFVFLRKGSLKYAYGCALLLGLLTAETPAGLIVVALCAGIYAFALKVMPVFESPFLNPAVIEVGKWYMTFIFLFALVFGVVLNCLTFISHSGIDAIGLSVGDIPLMYLKGYWNLLATAADKLGWLLVVAVAVVPFVVSIVRFPSAADEERFLAYPTGIVFLCCGLLAVAQSCSLPALWYWTYVKISSPLLISAGAMLSAATIACALTILGVDAFCRNHRRLALQIFGGMGDWSNLKDDSDEHPQSRFYRIARMAVLFLVPLVIVLVIVPGRQKRDTREMLSVIRDAITATVDEAGDSEFIFTDGNLDSALEIESSGRGGALKCVSLMGGNSPMAMYLRTRGLGTDREDVFSFRHDGGMGLRTWMRDKPERLARSSVQIGFDLWKRDGKAIPEIGGFLSRPATKVDPAFRARMVERAKELARRILAVRATGGFRRCTDRSIRSAFTSVQWRIARMCFYRGEALDLSGEAAEAIAEVSLAKELNDNNDVYRDLMRTVEKHNEMLVTRLTPREGLQLALVRADFTMAKLYAETILVAQPEHADANFAMGMYYQKQGQLSRAEEYLKRSLIGKPREPAVYNNLAMLQMELGKFDAALVNVEKALEIIPESSAVKDTKKQILQRRAEKLGK